MATYSLYDATIYMTHGALVSLRNLLNEASKQSNASELLTARLAPDMWPSAFQVQYACNTAQSIAARLSDSTPENEGELDPALPSETGPMTYDSLRTLINLSIAALVATDKATVNALGEGMMKTKYRDQEVEAPVKVTVGLVNMPNVYFHVSMAYAILRSQGVGLGKRYWSRGFVREFVDADVSKE